MGVITSDVYLYIPSSLFAVSPKINMLYQFASWTVNSSLYGGHSPMNHPVGLSVIVLRGGRHVSLGTADIHERKRRSSSTITVISAEFLCSWFYVDLPCIPGILLLFTLFLLLKNIRLV